MLWLDGLGGPRGGWSCGGVGDGMLGELQKKKRFSYIEIIIKK